MKNLFKYDIEILRPLIGKMMYGLVCVEDFRRFKKVMPSYDPWQNQFNTIQNLIIWYYTDSEYYSLKLFCVENGRFALKDSDHEEKLTVYGVCSIGTIANQDLLFSKRGSIGLRNNDGFSIQFRGSIKNIKLYQDVHKNLKKSDLSNVYPKLDDNSLFPDRLILESDDMYAVIIAEQDYDQNFILNCKVGMKNINDRYYASQYTEGEEYELILIDELE